MKRLGLIVVIIWGLGACESEQDNTDAPFDTGSETGFLVDTASHLTDTTSDHTVDTAPVDTNTTDTTTVDTATTDTAPVDTNTTDTTTVDTVTTDTAPVDTNTTDTTTVDTVTTDTAPVDTNTTDTATVDTATTDTAPVDTATVDTATTDTAPVDTNTTDTTTVDTVTTDTAPACQPSIIEPVARADGQYVLEFTDCTNTWRFAATGAAGGRITDFELNSDELLTTSAVNSSNYGSSFWISPQSLWGWPPPDSMNTATYQVSADEVAHTITLNHTGILIGGTQFGITKTFGIDLANLAITLEYQITNISGATQTVATWEITRVLPGGLTFYPMGQGAVTSGSFNAYPNTNIGGTVWADHANITQAADYKLFSDGSNGWLAHTDGNLVFVKSFTDVPYGAAASGEGEIELYANLSYEEVEQQSAAVTVAPGQSASSGIIRWTLRYLPAGANAQAGDTLLLNFVKSLVPSP